MEFSNKIHYMPPDLTFKCINALIGLHPIKKQITLKLLLHLLNYPILRLGGRPVYRKSLIMIH